MNTNLTTDRDPDLIELHRRALGEFGRRVHGVGDEGWHQPTPCAEWDVRQLVNHVVGENRWTPPILAGSTVTEVGDRFDGDLLGNDAVAAWDASVEDAIDAAAPVALDATVHLSFGDVPAGEYLWQLTADALVHSWDLARATGQDERLDPSLVTAVSSWFDDREQMYRAAGVIGPPVASEAEGEAARLLGRFGRDASDEEPLAVIGRFNAAFNAHDLDRLRSLITDDCCFVDTSPPRGTMHRGADAVIAAFGELFAGSPTAHFVTLGGFAGESGATIRWLYRWGDGDADCIEGVDVFACRDGKVSEKRAYVKG